MQTTRGIRSDVVVITGATAGVGRATARAFARRRAHVALLARGEEGLQATKEEVEAAGGFALAIPTDVADPEAVEAAADRITTELGPIDIWVNCAMTTVFAQATDITPEEFKRATEVTYLGTVWGTMAALRRMVARNQGVIVQVGSALAYRAIPLQSAYCGAKHAVRGFTDSVRVELRHHGSEVQLTMVQLPAVNTPQFTWCKTKSVRQPRPVPPVFQPEVAADAVVYAAYHPRREIYVTTAATKVILGNKLFPRMGDWYLSRNAYEAQHHEGRLPADRPFNLFEPVPGDHGAHGIFDDEAKSRSVHLWLNERRAALAAGAVSLAGLVAVLALVAF